MKAAKTATPRTVGFLFPLLLVVILAVLFCKSFLPDYVHFSNDGPLGEINAAWARPPASVTGLWDDLNDIGTSGGVTAPDVTMLESWVLGPVGFSKFSTPIALFILGMGAWTFFRQLKLSPLAAALGALAAVLNSSYFGDACWGTSPHQIAMGMVFFALALVMANADETRPLIHWTRLALAGMAVGISVMEGADMGAIFSLFVAAYVFFKSLAEENGLALEKVRRGIGHVAIIAVFALFIAWQTVTALVSTFVVGAATLGADQETSQQHWDGATEWSLPKKETLGIFVPGLFGYRMDTPKDMMGFLQKSYVGGQYWGGVGRTPDIDRFFDSGAPGSPPPGLMRFGYGGFYCGILVALVALFAIIQSLRKNSIFPLMQQRLIWFWTAVMIIALLLAWGRFAPFYKFFYMLPYVSTIRNPAKFLAIFSLAIIIIFAYGMDALSRCYLQQTSAGTAPSTGSTASTGTPISWLARFKNRCAMIRGFDRHWIVFSVIAFLLGVLAWRIYHSHEAGLIGYLQKVGFGEDDAKVIAHFSIGQAGWFLLFFAAAVALVILVIAGVFSGKRARLGGFLLGALLVIDMGRANLPWIIHWNYKQKYASNDIIKLLSDKPYEHRVAYLLPEPPLQTPDQFALFDNLYRIEWMQHHFPYYNIQCLDKIQQPRMPADLAAYEGLLRIGFKADSSGQVMTDPATFPLVTKLWELTNTRYLLGPAPLLDDFNQAFDPVEHRFRIVKRFNIVPKPGIENPTELEQLTVAPDENGPFALFEFTGALPRAGLYSDWQVNTNDDATLKMLADPNFNPQKTVLVSNPLSAAPTISTSANPGAVQFKSYAPKDIVLSARATAPSVLLLNDKFDPDWRVSVDGKPAELLRCNFIMRGVFLAPGAHTVEFQFSLPHRPLYVTLTAIGVGILLCGVLFFYTRRPPLVANQSKAYSQTAKTSRTSAGNRNPSPQRAR